MFVHMLNDRKTWQRGAVPPPAAWTPANLTGLLAWHDAKDLATITAASSLISAWNDKSGNNNHLTEATNKPNYSSSAQLGGVNVIDCGPVGNPPVSSGRKMSWTSAITTAKAIFAVVGTGANASLEGGGFLFGSTGSTYPFHRGGTSHQEGYLVADPLVNVLYGDADWRDTAARRNGATVNPSIQGFTGQSTWNIVGLKTAGSAAGSFDSINFDRGTSRGGADWAEIIVLNAVPSDNDIKRIEGYLKNRWATVTLPEIHPYASARPHIGDTPVDNPLTSHRWWRMVNFTVMTRGENYSGMSELEVYETIGGANAMSSATLSTSVALRDGALSDLTNGNLSADRAQWDGQSFDVIMDFGSGQSKILNQVGIAPNKDAVGRSPQWFVMQYSDDGTNFHDSWLGIVSSAYTLGTIKKVSPASI
ncbi:hypothetical protein EN851_03565 [Mesorhizobium sp. M8A.F.Ca.ET.208.01.1.1]|uniref:hypothetical protein n=1 Tax=unclassified Mesorhizobium TaxID=325217 RepID=UPI001093C645|nr:MULTISPECIES: hypothetical protein [unclassified Mesorhizobium]TGQ94643.1 hypothetical protein EN851_03565 [Mesorhizobium sp. M8A.F.Ca.ET.208.01.1.1]TGT55130.1 hypothetical protein EN810_03565 [Mesorhizobium sp. M8A.F.Ca.ET.167.01.1.1]